MKRPLAFALLAFACGCADRPATTNEPAPATSTSTSAAPAPAPAPVTSGPDGAGSPGRFIVCPGDRRCPRRNDGKPPESTD